MFNVILTLNLKEIWDEKAGSNPKLKFAGSNPKLKFQPMLF